MIDPAGKLKRLLRLSPSKVSRTEVSSSGSMGQVSPDIRTKSSPAGKTKTTLQAPEVQSRGLPPAPYASAGQSKEAPKGALSFAPGVRIAPTTTAAPPGTPLGEDSAGAPFSEGELTVLKELVATMIDRGIAPDRLGREHLKEM